MLRTYNVTRSVDINSSLQDVRRLAAPGPGHGNASGPPPRPRRSLSANQSYYPSRYGMYGGAASYSMYGGGYSAGNYMGGGYGVGPFENRFVQLAEESSMPAFQRVESFVRAFTSISMMMESTYHAMSMSFRAVLSVAENMSRLKGVLSDILASLAIFRRIRYFYRRILYMLRLINKTQIEEEAWRFAEGCSDAASQQRPARNSLLPLAAVFGLFLGGPYVLYTLFAPKEGTDSIPQEGMMKVVTGYDFIPAQSDELGFKKGEVLLVRQSDLNSKRSWLMAWKGQQSGMVPLNYLAIVHIKKNPQPKVQKLQEPVIEEDYLINDTKKSVTQ
ncbi:peroxisomal membrane protein PEX13 isoform X2 [Cimex lectularius]|uniref:Peroxisomal membrane protein PEX13 n=1 Tax=Cimex lectularius TaxID=79782 RepID=A0A8I6S6Z0_CIMLE|nr:peroxisomal membrane protein PEX13 isoform X2 [Cimex lectularius]